MSVPVDVSAALPALQELGRVHLIAVGGAGMSAVARLLLAHGMPVTGSDSHDSPVLAALAEAGAVVRVGHDAAAVEGAGTVVVSSAVREDNVELRAARAAAIPVLHRSQALAVLMRGRRRVAVAGANGKTTTASMLAVALRRAGAGPSFAIGGEITALGTNAHLGDGDAFVVEADESDGSFLGYAPHVAVVTSVQPDHLDFYGSVEALESAYSRFAATVVDDGLLVACADDEGARSLAAGSRDAGRWVMTYGMADDADLRLQQVQADGLACSASLLDRKAPLREVQQLQLQVPGRHNLLNAAAAYLAATRGLRQDPRQVLDGLASFTGTRRRFEVMGEVAGVRVVDDYAHNPGKVAAVVETALALAAPGRLVAVFQPHLFSRTRDFADQLGRALAAVDVLLVTDVYAAREDPLEGVTGELVADAAKAGGTHAEVHYLPALEAVVDALATMVRPGDLVVTIGAGDVTTVGAELLARLSHGGVS